jgi:prepilin-type N-terminal cleavage/methylation domain-containing protein
MVRNNKGMSLIEVLAAVVILSIVILSFINISGYTALSSSKTDKKAGALRLAEQKLNSIRYTIGTSIPVNGSQNQSSTSGIYTIDVYDTLLNTPSYLPVVLANKVTLQDIFIMKNGSNDESRLIVVTVSWAG